MQLDAQFWTALLQIVGVNIVLSGDNAVVIALACRSLPPDRQRLGVLLGAGAAIVLRIVFTVFIATLLQIDYLKIAGALLLFWVGAKLMLDSEDEHKVAAGTSLWQAVRIVLVADAVMSLDNVIAVAAAANGNYVLLILGLVLSVPLVIFGATVLIKLLNRYPLIVPAGAALIGYVGGEVAISDPVLIEWVEHYAPWLHWAAPLIGAVAIVLVCRLVNPTRLRTAQALGTEGIVGPTVLIGFRVALQVIGRLIAVQAPLLIGFLGSALGYAVSHEDRSSEPLADAMVSVAQAVRPIFVAILAIGLGELAAWLARKLRRPAADGAS